jgi:hypothetical protein
MRQAALGDDAVDDGGDAVGQRLQQLVADLVAVLVVDELEVVDVDEEQGAADILGFRLLDDLRRADVEIFPVRDAGQRVRPGGVLHEVEGLH